MAAAGSPGLWSKRGPHCSRPASRRLPRAIRFPPCRSRHSRCTLLRWRTPDLRWRQSESRKTAPPTAAPFTFPLPPSPASIRLLSRRTPGSTSCRTGDTPALSAAAAAEIAPAYARPFGLSFPQAPLCCRSAALPRKRSRSSSARSTNSGPDRTVAPSRSASRPSIDVELHGLEPALASLAQNIEREIGPALKRLVLRVRGIGLDRPRHCRCRPAGRFGQVRRGRDAETENDGDK